MTEYNIFVLFLLLSRKVLQVSLCSFLFIYPIYMNNLNFILVFSCCCYHRSRYLPILLYHNQKEVVFYPDSDTYPCNVAYRNSKGNLYKNSGVASLFLGICVQIWFNQTEPLDVINKS